MSYETLANATATIHFAILLAVVVGLLVSFRYKRFRPWEAGALVSIVILWSYYGNCPLTIIEEHFRTLAGSPSGITNVGFLPYYANKLISLDISSRLVQKTTFFTGGAIFVSSIEWLAPVMHMEIFKIRKIVHRMRRRVFA
ncbi:MAG: DUF2784 family protein [Minisyncoccia bacterium]